VAFRATGKRCGTEKTVSLPQPLCDLRPGSVSIPYQEAPNLHRALVEYVSGTLRSG